MFPLPPLPLFFFLAQPSSSHSNSENYIITAISIQSFYLNHPQAAPKNVSTHPTNHYPHHHHHHHQQSIPTSPNPNPNTTPPPLLPPIRPHSPPLERPPTLPPAEALLRLRLPFHIPPPTTPPAAVVIVRPGNSTGTAHRETLQRAIHDSGCAAAAVEGEGAEGGAGHECRATG